MTSMFVGWLFNVPATCECISGIVDKYANYVAGESISDKDKCKECRGKKVTNETKILEVHVDKGMKHEQKIPFRGEGDQLVSGLN